MVYRNLPMREMLNAKEAIDVSKFPKYGGAYILPRFVEDIDYCNARTEEWIWSIGRRKSDGTILASHSCEFYQNAEYDCLFLR